MPAKPRKAPKPTVLREFFGSLDDKTRGLLLLTLNLETNSELSTKGKQEKLEAELLRRAK
jgi:16S rRNA U516 pseudouridylate synthase RsuA-like enzyme